MKTISWDEARERKLAAMTASERAEYDRALIEAEISLNLAQLVYDARIGAGLTQTDLARRAGTTQGAISAIESANKIPTVVTLRRIADALNTNLEVAFIGTSDKRELIPV